MSATTDDLVQDVRELAELPDAGKTDAEILRRADAELTTLLAAMVKTARQEHWMTPTDTACDGTRVVFGIPRRALDRAFRDVRLVTATGVEIPCYELNAGEPWPRSQFHYYVQKSTIIFLAAPTNQYTLRIRSRTRPSRLVPTASCAPIVTAPSTTTLTLASSFAGLAGALRVDIVNGDSPHDLGYYDLLTSGLSGLTLTLDASTPVATADFTSGAIGNDRVDYVCLRDTTCYPPLPEAALPVLAAATATSILASQSTAAAGDMRAIYQSRLTACLSLISPQNEEGGRPIINRNSALRGGGGGIWRRSRW